MSARPLPASHPDYSLLAPIAAAIEARAGGEFALQSRLPALFRQAVDEVIDAPRTNRFTIAELEKTEKTYLGTKVEILVRDYLKLPKGRILDLSVDGVEVDIKNTMQRAWTIPLESHGHPALLFRLNEISALCDVGLVLVRPEYLNAGQNRDGKRTLSAEGTSHIWWLLWRHPYPANFWEVLPDNDRREIFAAGSASARLTLLFSKLQRRAISRLQVQAVAQQHDYMKRLRRNGGARDVLVERGIALLSGRSDGALVAAIGLGPVGPEEFISITPQTNAELALLRAAGQLP